MCIAIVRGNVSYMNFSQVSLYVLYVYSGYTICHTFWTQMCALQQLNHGVELHTKHKQRKQNINSLKVSSSSCSMGLGTLKSKTHRVATVAVGHLLGSSITTNVRLVGLAQGALEHYCHAGGVTPNLEGAPTLSATPQRR